MLAYVRHALAFVVTVFLAAAVYTAILIGDREARLSESSRASLQWTASQTVSEMLRLEAAIARAAVGVATIDNVRLRFSIFSNRVSTLTRGEFSEFAAGVPAVLEAVELSQVAVDTIAPLVDHVANPDVARQALAPLKEVARQLIGMAATTFRHSSEMVTREQAEVFSLHWRLSMLIFGLVVCGLMLIVHQYWGQQLLRQVHQDLERTATDLKLANEKAVAASEAKSLFLANMSHEIRTPMNGVFGMTDLLRRTPLNKNQRRLVDTINQSSKTLLGIINDILDLSRIEAGRMQIDDHDFDPGQCVEDAANLFADETARKNIDLAVRIDPNVPALVRGDGGRLRQVCINLIGNAVKFTPAGRVFITLTASSLDDGACRLDVAVRDTGIGMSATTLDEVQKPFTQADASISRRFGGTGLGLSIARQLTGLMNGSLAVESTLGVGTTVTASVSVQIVAPPAQDCDALRGIDVLLVDGNTASVPILAEYLVAAGAMVRSIARADVRPADLWGDVFLIDVPLGEDASVAPSWWQGDVPIIALATAASDLDSDMGETEQLTRLARPMTRAALIEAVAGCVASSKNAPPASTTLVEPPLTAPIRMRALVAEDNPVNQEIAREFLRLLGCDVEVVENGQLAVDAVEARSFDVVFMDFQMPVVDGLTAARCIRGLEQREERKRVPIIALTANAYSTDRELCVTAGMDDHVAKPFTYDQLATVLARHVKSAKRATNIPIVPAILAA